ncbi:iron-sulfur cluster assembly accessory protein [Aliifodinibius sp. S!AR15-10]|uniref:HesB/IscA family protein n=1 Tax=Aliifodinibius sp. S!AR15-10 TaxID=2950437 RepID=UPI00285F3E16|nr:iron-sulfur cluster assembly accessory protein [Aliifodinibius sp. S!AR15-10]MDR8391047.1 iron-sulfur cluster assembly accessory protein [Aliifodinibius sp. S!AR15-10]
MSISVSERAADRINEIRKEQDIREDALLRVGVVSGGCSGLTYELDFDTKLSEDDDKEKLFEDKGIRLVVDMRSFLYLSGTTLDFTEGLNGEGFHFHNPNASRTCSCGESFSI